MKKIILCLFVFVLSFNSFARMGVIHLHFIKDATVTGRPTAENICVVDCPFGKFLIEVDGTPLSDYMIAVFLKYQNSNWTLNVFSQTLATVYYTGTGDGVSTFPGSGMYLLLTSLSIVDNEGEED